LLRDDNSNEAAVAVAVALDWGLWAGGVAVGDTWREGSTTTCAGVRAANGTHTANK